MTETVREVWFLNPHRNGNEEGNEQQRMNKFPT
jgi:hypothetical protein